MPEHLMLLPMFFANFLWRTIISWFRGSSQGLSIPLPVGKFGLLNLLKFSMAFHKITWNEAVYCVVYLLLSSIIMCCNFFFLVQNGSLHQKDTVHDNDFEPYLSGQSNQVSVFLTFFFSWACCWHSVHRMC